MLLTGSSGPQPPDRGPVSGREIAKLYAVGDTTRFLGM